VPDSLRRFAGQHGLSEIGAEAHRRVLHLRATPQALERAFGVTLGSYQFSDGRGPFVGCDQAPTLPPEALAVLGLDRRPVARVRSRKPRAAPIVTYTPIQLGQLYSFPAGADGSGETVAIIELGGGFTTSDLAQYFKSLGIARAPTVTAVAVAGGANQPGGDADGEVMLDIEVIGALAPGANIVVYFAPNTDQGFYEAISQAAHDAVRKPSVMSISWGGPEDSWTGPSRNVDADCARGRSRARRHRDGRRRRQRLGRWRERRPAARRLSRLEPERTGMWRHQAHRERRIDRERSCVE